MKKRKPLKQHTKLCFAGDGGGRVYFTIERVVGLGGSCIVYDGYYRNHAGSKNTVRVKECYPYQLHLERSGTGALFAPEREREAFEEHKKRFRKSFALANELHETAGLTNATANMFDRYEGNGTVYIVSSYVEGATLSDFCFDTLKDAARAVLGTAKSIEKIHRKGYLYLDIKPENILMYPETPDMVQLFDFDAVIPMGIDGNITKFKLACSEGFAPPEQRRGQMLQIGKYTDIYSIGALLFYLLFGRCPLAADCGSDADYDYGGLKWDAPFRDKLYRELRVFFSCTIRTCARDRYQEMGDVVACLEKIVQYADMQTPFFYSYFAENTGPVVGRERECGKLLRWYDSGERLVFVTGMGGIGKSTVVRKFVEDYREKFDVIVYMEYKGSVCDTITDDVQLRVNGYEKTADESREEYFARKLKAARALARDENALIVIDNFDGVLDEDFAELLRVDWKLIVVTRADMSHMGYACQKIGELGDKSELRQLFESNMERRLEPLEYHGFEQIVKLTGHTLVLVLIAKQISKSYLTVDETRRLLEVNGFSGIAPEKIDFVRDGNVYYDQISGIIRALFDISGLSGDRKKCLKILSLFDASGIEVRDAQALLKLESLDEINELKGLGWLEIAGRTVQMHPLIQETLDLVPWTDEWRAIAAEEMRTLCGEIKRDRKQTKGLKNRSSDKRLQRNLSVSKSVLLHCGKDALLGAEDVYRELMLVTLLSLPKDEEEYIIRTAEKLFQEHACKNPWETMELYEYVVYLLCQKKDFDAAQKYLYDAKFFAKKWKDHYIWGLYYVMLSHFCEEQLDGAYDTQNREQLALLKNMLSAVDKAISYMGKSGHEHAKYLYVKYMLGKAALLIRSAPEKSKKIRTLLSGVERVMGNYISDETEICAAFHMTRAFYFTLCEPDKSAVLNELERAADINARRAMSELDEIDDFYIPAADMMCELGDMERTFRWLEEAISVCDAHADAIPYIRKKLDLLVYKLEVCSFEGEEEEYGRVRVRMEETDLLLKSYGTGRVNGCPDA